MKQNLKLSINLRLWNLNKLNSNRMLLTARKKKKKNFLRNTKRDLQSNYQVRRTLSRVKMTIMKITKRRIKISTVASSSTVCQLVGTMILMMMPAVHLIDILPLLYN
jgi:hypothetical protein